jgi:hypothetical protein
MQHVGHTKIYTHKSKYTILHMLICLHDQSTQIGATLAFIIGAVNEEFLESAFLVLSGLGFIPGIMGTITDTMGSVTNLIMSHTEPILGALTSVKDMIMGVVGGILKAAGESGVLGGMAATLITESHGILAETLDTAKIDEALDAVGQEDGGGEAWLQRVRNIFDAIDTDKDGTLNRHEMKMAMKSKEMRNKFLHNDVLMSRQMFSRFFAHMDKDHNGIIDFEE